MPPPVSLTRETILAEALALVRAEGLESLTARRLAARLGCSVAPLYRTWGSMDELVRGTLRRIRELLEGRTARCSTGMAFRDVGLGRVLFARDEPRLYRALFQESPLSREARRGFFEQVEESMGREPPLDRLSPLRRRALLEELTAYTHGLALLCMEGEVAELDDEVLNRRIGRVGWAVIRSFLEEPGPEREGGGA